MTTRLLLKKMYLSGKEFLTYEDIKNLCNPLNLDYKNTVNYLLRKGYLLRIFRGIFYLKSLDEIKFGKSKYSHLELISKGMELKKVNNWYFALYTALKLNNLTHEHFAVDYVINDKIFRAKPIKIAGYKFKFVKLKPDLFKFGIIKDSIRYSDPEKTVIDFIYIWRYNGIPEEKIIMNISDYTVRLSKNKIMEYAKNYPKTVRAIAKRVVR